MPLFINLKIDAAKRQFFDAEGIIKRVDRATRKVLSRFGSFVRRKARTKTRKAKKSAGPGEPPKGKTGLLRKFIFFVYDESQMSVVIGPMRLNKGLPGEPDDELEILEAGGQTKRRIAGLQEGGPLPSKRNASGQFVKQKQQIRRHRDAPLVSVTYDPHPFMGPAFEAEKDKLPDLWKNSIA